VIVAHAWTAQNDRTEKPKERKNELPLSHTNRENADIYVFNGIRTRDPACSRPYFNVTCLQKQSEEKVMLDVTG
jgi:hypothetical protein